MLFFFFNSVFAISPQECQLYSNAKIVSSTASLYSPFDNSNQEINSLSSQKAKECALMSISNTMKKQVVNKVSQSVINWINSGFDGKPVYVTDPYQVFRSVKEQVVDEVIYGGKTLKYISPDDELSLKFALNNYYFTGKKRGELSYQPKPDKDLKPKKGDFYWDNYLERSLNTANNPIMRFQNIVDDIDNTIATRQSVIQQEIARGRGYLSIRKCDEGWEYNGSEESAKHCKIVTPGSTIADQISKVIGSDIDKNLLSDETNQLMGTFVDGILDKTLSSGGLASISDSSYSDLNVDNKTFTLQKKRLLKQFDSRLYDIAISILESNKKTLKNIQNKYEKTLFCWEGKQKALEEQKNFYKDLSVDETLPKYEKLSLETVNAWKEKVSNSDILTRIEADINNINKQILSLTEEKNKAGTIQIMINDAETYSDLYNTVNNSTIQGINLNLYIQQTQTFVDKYQDDVNGKVKSYFRGKPVRKGGLAVSDELCSAYKEILQLPDNATIIISSSDTDVINENNFIFKDSYDPKIDILKLDNDIKIDDFYKGISANSGIVDYSSKYEDLISLKYFSKAEKEKVFNWKDFFTKEKKIKFSGDRQYLALVKRNYQKNYPDYDFNFYKVDKKVDYQNGVGTHLIDNLPGDGKYCTKDGWNSYKIYIPPKTKKFGLLFRPVQNLLHRVHLTFDPVDEIDHSNVKPLSYSEIASDAEHFGLSDLFLNKKTVLLNIKYKGLFLSDKSPGVSVAGLIVGEKEALKYFKNKGSWLYIDIAQDNIAAGKVLYKKNNLVEIFYYVDVDQNTSEYSNWIKANPFEKTQKIVTIENKCDD